MFKDGSCHVSVLFQMCHDGRNKTPFSFSSISVLRAPLVRSVCFKSRAICRCQQIVDCLVMNCRRLWRPVSLCLSSVWCVLLLLQFVNLVLFVLQIYLHFIGNIWFVFAIILFEGLLGGAAYVNSFYQISKRVTHLFTLSVTVSKLQSVERSLNVVPQKLLSSVKCYCLQLFRGRQHCIFHSGEEDDWQFFI